MDGERRPGHLRQRSGDGRLRAGSTERPWRRDSMIPPQGGYNGFKMAVAVIVFHFGVKMLVQFADLLLPFIMALLLVTVLEPLKQVTLENLECSFILILSRTPCRCCLRTTRKGQDDKRLARWEVTEHFKRVLLFVSIVVTILLASRVFWFVGQIVWLSGEAVMDDFSFYRMGVTKRTSQVQELLHRFHLEKSIPTDMKHMGDFALSLLHDMANFLSQHVFYTLTQVSLTAIFVLFLLFSPVQRDFSPVMQGVFQSMELYLKLKTFISVMMGITNGIALAIIGLELPAAWGLLTFLANFIPNIGGPVISIVPCVISLLDYRKSLYQVTAAFLAQFFLHFNIANFVEPVVFGTTEEIHSVVVLLGLSFFGYIWGFTGMFLSVPLLFAWHSWLQTIAKTESYGQEAREDARFIMGMLEGRWLADSAEDVGEGRSNGGVNLLTGHIEEEPEEDRNVGHAASAAHEAHIRGGKKEHFWDARNEEGEVKVLILLLRWVLLAGALILCFFGFEIFHFDLHVLIHPSGGDLFLHNLTSTAPSQVVELASTSGVPLLSTTSLAAVLPFRSPPELDPGMLEIHSTGVPSSEGTREATSEAPTASSSTEGHSSTSSAPRLKLRKGSQEETRPLEGADVEPTELPSHLEDPSEAEEAPTASDVPVEAEA